MGLNDDCFQKLWYVVVLLFGHMFYQCFVADILCVKRGFVACRCSVVYVLLRRM